MAKKDNELEFAANGSPADKLKALQAAMDKIEKSEIPGDKLLWWTDIQEHQILDVAEITYIKKCAWIDLNKNKRLFMS